MKDIAIYGAGGFGREVACLIQSINRVSPEWNLIGFFDDTHSKGTANEYGETLGGMNELNAYDREIALVIGIGSPNALQNLFSSIVNPNVYYPNIIAPDVVFHDKSSVKMGKGNIILFHSIVSCCAQIGDFNLLNNDVMIGHDAQMGSFNVFNPSVRVSGNVRIGNTNFFGVCSVVLQKLTIGCDTKIAANSCVMRNTRDKGLYIGTPAIMRLTPEV